MSVVVSVNEKEARIYYQNLVYRACSLLDDALGGHISKGTGICCGCAGDPTEEFIDAIKQVVQKAR